MKSMITLFGAALLSFGAVSCDSPQENAADAGRDNAERRADSLEDTADSTRDQQ